MTTPHGRRATPVAKAASDPGGATSVPAARDGAPRPAAPPELDYNGRRHRRAMDDATLRDMARRIPRALAQTARLAWSADRRMAATVVVCQLLSGAATALMLGAVARALPRLTASDPGRGRRRRGPP